MERTEILELAVEIGFRLEECGAEIYRVEDAVSRIFKAYGVESGQVFAIPNCLIVSIEDEAGRPMTRMRRLPQHGTDVYRLERVYNYCREVCKTKPEPEEALARLQALEAQHPVFSVPMQLFGYFLGGGAFTLFWAGTGLDAFAGGLCSLAIGCCQMFLGRVRANLFARTVVSAFASAFLAILLVHCGLGENGSCITIGALMTLVPGVMFTNSMRDIMAGDMVAGLLRIVESLLIAAAIAMGTFVAIARGGLWGM